MCERVVCERAVCESDGRDGRECTTKNKNPHKDVGKMKSKADHNRFQKDTRMRHVPIRSAQERLET